MFFSGMTFAGMNNFSLTCTNVNNINFIKMTNGMYDELFITKNVGYSYTKNIPHCWDYDTILHALFQNNLYAGNFAYTSDEISNLIIKRRKKGDFNWTRLFKIPVNKVQDFEFTRYDKIAKAQTEYEYSLVPILNSTEGNVYNNSVYSDFDGIFILDKDETYNTILDIDISIQRNKTNSIVTTLGKKYPYVISNGENNYSSGTVSATFIAYNELKDEWLKSKSWDYRENLNNFLLNGNPKIIKSFDSRLWLAMITDSINESAEGHYNKIRTSFSFSEIAENNNDIELYINGFIEINPNIE